MDSFAQDMPLPYYTTKIFSGFSATKNKKLKRNKNKDILLFYVRVTVHS
jgi:hypothetical protein